MAKPIDKINAALLTPEELTILGQLPPSRATATRREKMLSSAIKDVLNTRLSLDEEDGPTYADALAVKAVVKLLEEPNARDVAALAKVIGDLGAQEVNVNSTSLMDRALEAIAIKREGGEDD